MPARAARWNATRSKRIRSCAREAATCAPEESARSGEASSARMAKLRRSRLLQGDAHARPAHVPARRVHVEGPIGLANYLSISRARRVQSLVVITRYDSFLHHIHCLDVVLGSLRAPFGTILLTCLLLTFLLENLIILGFGLHPLLSRFGVYLSFESCREKTCPVELRERRATPAASETADLSRAPARSSLSR